MKPFRISFLPVKFFRYIILIATISVFPALTAFAKNHAPVATAIDLITDQNVPVSGTVSATDADSDPLTFRVIRQPNQAETVTISSSGAFTYTPITQTFFFPFDSFTFVANDTKADSSPVTVQIKINRPPVASPMQFSIPPNKQLSGKLQGFDPDGNALSYTKTFGPSSVTITSDGRFIYTGNANNTNDSFTYTVTDGRLTSPSATVTLKVASDGTGFVADTLYKDVTIAKSPFSSNGSDLMSEDMSVATSALDLAVDRANRRLYVLTPNGLVFYELEQSVEGVTTRSKRQLVADIKGTRLALSLDARTLYVGSTGKVTAINLYRENVFADGTNPVTGKDTGKSVEWAPYTYRREFPFSKDAPELNKREVAAMGVHPAGDRLFVVLDMKATDKKLNINNDLLRSDVGNGQSAATVTLPDDFGYITELDIASNVQSSGKQRELPKFAAPVDIKRLIYSTEKRVAIGVKDIAFSPDGNCAFLTAVGAGTPRATPFGILPTSDEGTGGIVVLDVRPRAQFDISSWVQFLGFIPTTEKDEKTADLRLEIQRKSFRIVHPEVQWALLQYAVSSGIALSVSSNPLTSIVADMYVTDVMSEVVQQLQQSYRDYGAMAAYNNLYPRDMVGASSIAFNHTGDFGVVTLQDTNNLGLLTLTPSASLSGYAAPFDANAFANTFYIKRGTGKSINGFDAALGSGPSGWAYAWAYPQKVTFTSDDSRIFIGMAGGTPKADFSNKFGSADALVLRKQRDPDSSIFKGGNPPPGYNLVSTGAHQSPRLVATRQAFDSAFDLISDQTKAYNRWNSIRTISTGNKAALVSTTEPELNKPVDTTPGFPLPTSSNGVVSANDAFDKGILLPSSGIGYRLDNQGLPPELSANAASRSAIRAIEHLGILWHDAHLANQVTRPYFVVGYISIPGGGELRNSAGELLQYGSRNGFQVNFPYMSKVDGDIAHDFVTSNVTASPQNNDVESTAGFDKANMAKFLALLLGERSTWKIEIDPAFRDLLKNDPTVIAAMTARGCTFDDPLFVVHGKRNKDKSRRSFDSQMSVTFSDLEVKIDPVTRPVNPTTDPKPGDPPIAPGRIRYKVTLPNDLATLYPPNTIRVRLSAPPLNSLSATGTYLAWDKDGNLLELGKEYTLADLTGPDGFILWVDSLVGGDLPFGLEILPPGNDTLNSLQNTFTFVQWAADSGPQRWLAKIQPKRTETPTDRQRTTVKAETVGFRDTIVYAMRWVPSPTGTATKNSSVPTLNPATGEIVAGEDEGTLYVEAFAAHNAALRTRPLAIEIGGCVEMCKVFNCDQPGKIAIVDKPGAYFEVNDGEGGKLFVNRDSPGPELWQTKLLQYPYHNKDTQVVLDKEGAIRQVLTSKVLMDVQATAVGYVIHTFKRPSSPVFDPQKGLYQTPLIFISGDGVFISTLKVVRDFLAPENRILITKTESPDQQFAIEYSPVDNSWTLSENLDSDFTKPLRQKSTATTTETINGQLFTSTTRTVLGSSGEVVSKEVDVMADLSVGPRLVSSIIDPDGARRATNYEYNNQGDVSAITYPNGTWVKSDYDSEHREIKRIEPWLNAASTADPSACKVTTFDYTPLVVTAGDIPAPDAPRSTVVTVAGVETERSYNHYTTNVQQSIVTTKPGAAWNDPTNLVTTTRYVASGTFAGRVASLESPDGTLTLYEYRDEARGEVTVVKRGAPNAGRTAVVDGTITTTVQNSDKHEILYSVVDIASGLTIDERIAFAVDSTGRPLQWSYLDGSTSTTAYDCCGVSSETDRSGITTFYQHDVFKRVISESRLGITTRYNYDALGRVRETTRVGTDETSMILSRIDHLDLTGEKVNSYDALNRVTRSEVTYNADGTTTRTTTLPGGFTKWQKTARDGHLLETGGTAASPIRYECRVDNLGGVPCKVTRTIARMLDESTGLYLDSAEWTESWTDMAGRLLRVYAADGAYTENFYNGKNQLVRTVDPDGLTKLFAYNARGDATITAIDVNRNGTIDYAGTDHVTRSTTSYATKVWETRPITVARKTEEIWTEAGTDTPLLASTQEQSPGGLHSWTIQSGLLTHQETRYPEPRNGSWQVITTAPDQTTKVQAYVGGRLSSTTSFDRTGTQLSQVTLAYDAHGRTASTTDSRLGVTTITYTADNQVAKITAPHPEIPNQYSVTSNTYDARGMLARTQLPDLSETFYTYTPNGQLATVRGSQTYPIQYTYDTQGRVRTMTTWKDFAGNTGQAVTRWNYDSVRGWLTSKTYDASSGLGTQGPTYAYTKAGRLSTRTWARGLSTQYNYQSDGALATVDYSDATPDIAYQYYRHGQVKEVRDGLLDLGVISDANLRYRHGFTFDSALRPETETIHTIGDNQFTREYEVAGADTVVGRYHGFTLRNVGATDPFNSMSYTYDNAGRVQSVTGASGTYTYNYRTDASLLDSVASPSLTTSYTYQPYGNAVLARTNTVGATIVSNYGYTLNALGQRTAVVQSGTAFTAPTHYAYEYNEKGELINADHFEGTDPVHPGAPLFPETFAYKYDDIGNRTTATRGDIATTPLEKSDYTSNALNQYSEIDYSLPTTRSSLLQHDPDGNLTADDRWTYTWNGENRLIAMETSAVAIGAGVPKQKLEFNYDYQGRRTEKKVYSWSGADWSLTTDFSFVYDGWNLVAEFALNSQLSTTDLLRTHTWGLDLSGTSQGAGGVGGLLAINQVLNPSTYLPDPKSYAAAYDANGNLTGLVNNADGTLAASYEYDPFGNTIRSTGPAAAANPFRFSTKYTDDESSLLYYGFRFYDPSAGRWLSKDPSDENGGSNLYQMVNNNPVNSTDMLGLYQVDGHYYHLLSTLVLSGVPLDTAKELAFYSELPDELKDTTAFDSSDPKGTAGKILQGDQVLRDMGDWIHSLGLGSPAEILARRKCLSKLLREGRLNNMQKGLLLHALGDAYSHTFEAFLVAGPTVGFPSFLGHGLAWKFPDYISLRPGRYVEFAHNVQNIFNPGQSPDALNPLTRHILDPFDPVHSGWFSETYPGARELTQSIIKLKSGKDDPLTYRPEKIDEHLLSEPDPKEPKDLRLPTPKEIQDLLIILKCQCGP